ncbi:aromatic ring-hydroxylating dioxygenase subunit alpha [Mesorhizobium sp. M1006]|uniref:aromatic ring-hydroxylating oxygenase subunit alpha n=1 Tax=Mesorhizobium sp. M1006 TaxID=2957048 RepID=UPI003337BA3D
MMNPRAISPIVPARSLDARYYTAPEIFAKEQAGLLARTWQFAGHVSLLEKAGDYFTSEIAGQSLFCIRDRDGEVRTFYNVCQHRAHELLRGTGNSKLIVCPYHAWSYEISGRLLNGPNIKAVPRLDRNDICLEPVRTEVFLGFVFVNLDPDAKPMDEWFSRVRVELTEYVPHIERLKPLEWIEISEHCNWKVSVENYSECYHCQINHETFSTGVIKPETYDIQPQGYCLRHTTECQNLERMSYPIDLADNPCAGKYSSWFLWPTFSFQVYPGNVLNTYHWHPKGVDEVVVWRGWYTIEGADSELIRKLAAQDRATTVEEDIQIVDSVQRGLKCRGYRPGPLVVDPDCGVNSEHSIQVLQQWMREALDA